MAALTLETAAFTTLARGKIPPNIRSFLNVLAGEEADVQPWGCEGCLLAPGIGLVRERNEPRFLLCLRLGGSWTVMGVVPAFDPAILEHRDSLTVYPRSPAELEAERRRKEIEAMTQEEYTQAVTEEYVKH
ncbi:MAG: hypothetical protein RIE74_02125, partial [Pseudomonadales bacterium]